MVSSVTLGHFDLIEMYLLIKQRLKSIWVLIGLTIVANFFVVN